MRHRLHPITRLAFVSLFVLLTSLAQAQVDQAAIEKAEIMNLRTPEAGLFSSGQPTQEQLQVLAQSGVKHIINLRPSSEMDWDEGAYVQSLGMEYHNIPVAGADDLTAENAQKLDSILANLNGQSALVHCASSNRVGALRALTAHDKAGQNADAAIAIGKNWGLTSPGLEAAVRTTIGE